MLAHLPLGDLPQQVDGDRGDDEGGRVEVERQFGLALVGGEVRRDRAKGPADQGEQPEEQAGDRGGAEGAEQAVLVGLLELVRGTRFGTEASLAGVQNSEAHDARNWTVYIQVSSFAKPSVRLSTSDR